MDKFLKDCAEKIMGISALFLVSLQVCSVRLET